MSQIFPPDLQSTVQKYLALGNYSSEEALLRDALHALERLHDILEDIGIGFRGLNADLGKSPQEVDTAMPAMPDISRHS